MPELDTIEFVMRFALGLPTVAAWLWAIATGLAIFFLLGLFGGRIWNNSWHLSFGLGALVLFFAVLGAFCVFNLRTITSTEIWLKEQRTIVAQSIAKANRFQRSVMIDTWVKLEPAGAQTGLATPDQSGDQVRLTSPEDALVLSTIAAEQARSALRLKPPFLFGAALETRSAADIGVETVDAVKIGAGGFPRTVGSDNEWTVTAATIQTNHAFDACTSRLFPRLNDLRSACNVLLAMSILFPLVICSVKALDDIKVNPKA
ncbi:MAG: hypothetical protein EOP88_08110 [Verrucomicrobiaceae bacterium]|jgi:hypothetical protein|nr:MAG: hypothetical protein EOP88_08110 [Verrucomicrobiaceae bacterium]